MRLPIRILSLISSLSAVLLLVPALTGREEKAGTTLVVTVSKYSPVTGRYTPLPGVRLVACRPDRNGVRDRISNLDTKLDYALTKEGGVARITIASGRPWSLGSWQKGYVPEVISLSGEKGEASKISIAMIAAEDVKEYEKQNPGTRVAASKYAEFLATTAFTNSKEDREMKQDAIAGYKRHRPKSSILLPSYSSLDANSLMAIKLAAKKFPGVRIVCVVKPEDVDDAVELRKAGLTVLGHVDARHQDKGNAEAKKAVSAWYRKIPKLDGVFLDGQSTDSEHLDFYDDLTRHVRRTAKGAAPIVLGNAAEDFPKPFLTRDINTATCCLLQDSLRVPEDIELPDWVEAGFAERAGVLVTNLDKDHLEKTLMILLGRKVGYLSLSDARGVGELPTFDFLARTLQIVQAANAREPDKTLELPPAKDTPKLLDTRNEIPVGAIAEFVLPRRTKFGYLPNPMLQTVGNVIYVPWALHVQFPRGKPFTLYSHFDARVKWVIVKGTATRSGEPRLFMVRDGQKWREGYFHTEEPYTTQPSGKVVRLSVKIDGKDRSSESAGEFEADGKRVVRIELKP